jgi:hypothetical protein
LLSVVPLPLGVKKKKISAVPLQWIQKNANLNAESIIFFNIMR